ncbi:MAG: hypothetical protein GEV28_40505 [Actinophytocola sp.]|uniref:hypothetical protein n=1 Tax=Actinophytocola sp. TaxID=1872138 RepID=UPI001324430D|nr:hypothetical protein [Actinophytocola sp.]MPZ86320.1 hypothetical protein [Actinophytocola sp.]
MALVGLVIFFVYRYLAQRRFEKNGKPGMLKVRTHSTEETIFPEQRSESVHSRVGPDLRGVVT